MYAAKTVRKSYLHKSESIPPSTVTPYHSGLSQHRLRLTDSLTSPLSNWFVPVTSILCVGLWLGACATTVRKEPKWLINNTHLSWLVKRNLEYLVFLLIAKHFQNTPLYLSFLRLLISTISLPVNAHTTLQFRGNQLQGQVCNFSVSISIKLTSAS